MLVKLTKKNRLETKIVNVNRKQINKSRPQHCPGFWVYPVVCRPSHDSPVHDEAAHSPNQDAHAYSIIPHGNQHSQALPQIYPNTVLVYNR